MSSEMANAKNYYNWILDVFRPYVGQNVLEIGAGHGQLRPLLQSAKVSSFVSVDIDPELVRDLNARSGEEGTYILSDVSRPEFMESLNGQQFDTVFCINVLEHIEDDRNAVSNMMNVLVPGGRLLLLVPAFDALYSDMDRIAGHIKRYSRSALLGVGTMPNSKITMIEFFNPIGGVGWWMNTFRKIEHLEGKALKSQIRVFDRYLLPISRAMNPLTTKFFGQSLVCCIEKTS